MTSEAELRARYHTSRFRETGRQASPIQADGNPADPPQTPIIDTANLNILEEEGPRGLMADQYSGVDEEDAAAANTDTDKAIGVDEEDPASVHADTEPGRVGIGPSSTADAQNDDSPALHRLTPPDENTGIQADPTPPPSQSSTSNVPSSTPPLTNEEGIQAQMVSNNSLGAGVPSSHAPPVESGILTLPLNPSDDIPAQSSITPDIGTPGARYIEDDTERLVSAENVDPGRLDGTTSSTEHRYMRGDNSDSGQGRAVTSQRSEHDNTAAGITAAGGDEATVETAGPPRWQPDAEVTYCPICRTQFNFFIRKHHCR